MIETNNVEFKRELNDKFEKEVVSFLNSKGGHIFIGINDDGSIYGVDNVDDLQLIIKDRIKDKIAPSPVGFFEIISEEKTIYIELALIKQGIGKSTNSFS